VSRICGNRALLLSPDLATSSATAFISAVEAAQLPYKVVDCLVIILWRPFLAAVVQMLVVRQLGMSARHNAVLFNGIPASDVERLMSSAARGQMVSPGLSPPTRSHFFSTLLDIMELKHPNLMHLGRYVMQSTILLVRAVAITATMIAAMNGLLNPNESIALFSLKVAAILALILGGYLFGEFARFLQHADEHQKEDSPTEHPRSIAMAAE